LRAARPSRAPTGKFDPKAPPPVKDGAQPAGHVMVSDTLWSGTGGHPWENADEFFASAYGGFLRAPALLKASIAFYAKLDARIAPLASDLLDLLGKVGKPKELGALKRTPKPAAAEQELAKVNRHLSSGAAADGCSIRHHMPLV
jgi:hypothetical protein